MIEPDQKLENLASLRKEELFAHLDRYNKIVTYRFGTESDRSAAILSSVYLEVLLERLLKTKFLRDVPKMFSGNGPLSTFSSRADLAYALGLFDENIYHDLSLIRRIRNDFAHDIDAATFATQAISQRCSQFWFVRWLATDQPEHTDPRTRFLLTVSYLTLAMTAPFHSEWTSRLIDKR